MRSAVAALLICTVGAVTALPSLPLRSFYANGRLRPISGRPGLSMGSGNGPIDTSSNPNLRASFDNLRNNGASMDNEDDDREQLFEAYNMLHSLAQDFKKPFDSPAVVVVGHQTSGKSALLEALMGFQFNQVGGGTKTRRPIALRMQYNPSCKTPVCFLTLENGKEEMRSLADVQAYIEAENKRLEKDSTRCYDSREINIRVEYKYCPNMIVIDTPGMLHPPKGTRLSPQQRALAQAAKEAEALVLNKIKCPDYIILCVEDTTDWKHATTRNVVMQVDPLLSRTVLVTTKLDTKLPQFSEGEDLEDFLKAPLIEKLFPQALGGPFFTSVPSGRVGAGKEFESNEAYVENIKRAEAEDAALATAQMSQSISQPRISESLKNVGVSKLRAFLEQRIEDNYRRNVAKILPLLQNDLKQAEARLAETDTEINALSVDRLKNSANAFREKFARELTNVIHGTAKASPEVCGETLDSEQSKSTSFVDHMQLRPDVWRSILEVEVGNNKHKLFGGAQYHRALREFSVAVRHMPAPPVSENEIANAAGMGDMHDGVNFMRAACVLAMEKAQTTFDPLLEAMRVRTTYIMSRLFNIIAGIVVPKELTRAASVGESITHSPGFQDLVHSIYDKFVQEKITECLHKCRDDLHGMTRFVTWDVDGRGGSSTLYKSLPTPHKMVEIYSVALENSKSGKKSKTAKDEDEEDIIEVHSDSPSDAKASKKKPLSKASWKVWSSKGRRQQPVVSSASVLDDWESATGRKESGASSDSSFGEIALRESPANEVTVSDNYELLQLTEEMLAGRDTNRTSTVISALVQFIVKSWQEHFAKTVSMKFNCFFLLPFIDEFPQYLRDELDKIYESVGSGAAKPGSGSAATHGFNILFDVSEARSALLAKRLELAAECEANSKLQSRFDAINAKMQAAGHHVKGGPEAATHDATKVSSNSAFNSETSDSGMKYGSHTGTAAAYDAAYRSQGDGANADPSQYYQ